MKALLPIVLLLHGGGWTHGSATDEAYSMAAIQRTGLRAVSIDYPLNDPMGAMRAAQKAARYYHRRGRKVFAYGHSAGGTIAAQLAARGQVDAAVIWEAPINLFTWRAGYLGAPKFWENMGVDRSTRRSLSPVHRIDRNCTRHTLLLYGDKDTTVGLDQMQDYRYRANQMGCRPKFVLMRGACHWFYPKWDAIAARWLKERSYPDA